jgi:ABC-type Zn uptake system ZnuABC Zn-binding protein ZnuA
MKSALIILILSSFIAYLPQAKADTVISCSHSELCRLAQTIFTENHMQKIQFNTLVKIVGDPHEFEPSTAEVKNLIRADILIAGPAELNPWIKKVNYQRSKTPALKTINIPMDKTEYSFYPNASHEALSHFWLYPKIYCALKSKLEEQLIAMNMLLVVPTKKTCSSEVLKIETELSKTLEEIKMPVVLTHDALLPLLESLNKNNAKIVAIKGSGHHQETNPQAIKNLYDALRMPKVIWVEETGINVPQNILAKKRSGDITIKIDTANSNGTTYFPILLELNEKLKALKI